jgi:hypothetical protein
MDIAINLVDWLKERAEGSPQDFPRESVNYYDRFKGVSDYLNADVHPEVEKLAILIDGGLLTGHGPDHIKTVIRRASELIGSPKEKLSGYEVYILLLAIHFHDVGNAFGRAGHEQNNFDVMNKCKGLLGNDSIEMRVIQRVAEAHGGSDKDKISRLPVDQALNNKAVRMQKLAALLRFADELSDDKSRANRFALDLGKIPTESEVFHKYAFHLHSVSIEPLGRAVNLDFEFTESVAMTKFGKLTTKVFLLDEIFARTMKMHLEGIYCMRFLRDIAPIDKINVHIDIFDNEYKEAQPRRSINYQLKETGYPESSRHNIFKICPELKDLTGSKLRKLLKHKSQD